jgi:hypothetical protein
MRSHLACEMSDSSVDPLVRAEEGSENTAGKTVATQPGNNGGTLQVGNPGNAGGTGRPPSVLRERLRGSLEQRVSVLEAIADDPEVDPQDRIRAIDVMGKYGIGTLRELSVDQVRERLRETIHVIRTTLSKAEADDLLSQMREIWGR